MKFENPVHIAGAKRTPIGKIGGALSTLSAVELATIPAQDVLTSIEPESVEQAIIGQVLQAGTGMNLARQVALLSGLPQSTPAFTVNMVCGSGLQAVALGAREIAFGGAGCVLTGGAESMSSAPHYAHLRSGKKFGDAKMQDAILCDGLTDPQHGVLMGETAERLAQKYNISRSEQDAFSLESHQRAVEAQEYFARETVVVQSGRVLLSGDETPRADTSIERLAALKPVFREAGSVTAGNSSGLSDGAAALLLAGETTLNNFGLESRARVVGAASAGCDPLLMGLGPVFAIRKLCAETGWNLGDVNAIEINEAFAAQTLACVRELELRDGVLNRRGGAIALGHPIGCSGARILVTLLHIMEDEELHRGIAALCIGGGMGIAMAIERV